MQVWGESSEEETKGSEKPETGCHLPNADSYESKEGAIDKTGQLEGQDRQDCEVSRWLGGTWV